MGRIKHFILLIILSSGLLTAQNDTLKTKEYLQGIEALSQKDTSKALDFFKESAKYNKDAASNFKIAQIRSADKSQTWLTVALQYLEKAIKLEPGNIQYMLLDAKIREELFYISGINLEERSAAMNEYRAILKLDSTNYEANSNLGRMRQEDFLQYNRSKLKNEQVKKLSSLEKEDLERMMVHSNNAPALMQNSQNEFLEKNNEYATFSYDKITAEMLNESEHCFEMAIKSNPAAEKNYLLLTQMYIDNYEYSKAVDVLTSLIKQKPSFTLGLTYLGLAYHLMREDEKASQEFNRAMTFMDKHDLEDYKFNTVKLLLEPKFGSRIDEMDNDQVYNLISTFWQINDPLLLTSYNERLLEHYSRVAYANLFFGVPTENIPGWQTDRGEILIRYGQPISKVRYRTALKSKSLTLNSLTNNFSQEEYSRAEVWYYTDMTFVFEDIYRNNHYRFNNPERRTTQFPNNTSEDVIKYREAHFQEYTPEYEGPSFKVPFAVYQFKSSNPNFTDAYLSYSINPKDSSTLKETFDEGYNIGLFYLDRFLNKKISEKKFFKALEDNSPYVNSLFMEAQPDSGSLAFEMIRKKDKGVFSLHGRFGFKNFSETDLEMSDVVLSSDVEENQNMNGDIVRKNISVLPKPGNHFAKNSPLFLYYEIYNLSKGQNNLTDFEQRITIQKKENGELLNSILQAVGLDKSGNKVRLSSNYQTQDKDSQMYLQLDMSKYEPGDYIINVSVKDKISGAETSSSAELIQQ